MRMSKLHWYQFPLRTWFLMIAIVAAVAATAPMWSAPRLEDLLEDFNQAIDEERFADAHRLAKNASRHYPDSPTSKNMQWMADRGFDFSSINWVEIECFRRPTTPDSVNFD